MVLLILLFYFSACHLLINYMEAAVCGRRVGEAIEFYCCLNSFMAKNGECEECKPGTKTSDGKVCHPCPSDTYGKDCKQRCSCTKEQVCDPANGCTYEVQLTTTSSKYQQFSTVISTASITDSGEENYWRQSASLMINAGESAIIMFSHNATSLSFVNYSSITWTYRRKQNSTPEDAFYFNRHVGFTILPTMEAEYLDRVQWINNTLNININPVDTNDSGWYDVLIEVNDGDVLKSSIENCSFYLRVMYDYSITDSAAQVTEVYFETVTHTHPQSTTLHEEHERTPSAKSVLDTTLVYYLVIGGGSIGWIVICIVSVRCLCKLFTRKQCSLQQQQQRNTVPTINIQESSIPIENDYDDIEDIFPQENIQSRSTSYLSVIGSEKYYLSPTSGEQIDNRFSDSLKTDISSTSPISDQYLIETSHLNEDLPLHSYMSLTTEKDKTTKLTNYSQHYTELLSNHSAKNRKYDYDDYLKPCPSVQIVTDSVSETSEEQDQSSITNSKSDSELEIKNTKKYSKGNIHCILR